MVATDSQGDPLVSVIIPVYNGERYLAETIESVVAQTYRNWELIAVNDGSPDNSRVILEEYARKHPDRIRVITVKNGGVSRARNTGVSNARGTYIAFIDQDDLWDARKLERQLDQFRANRDLGLSFTNESIIDEHGSRTRENVLRFNASKNRGFVFGHLIFENFIPISSVMLTKEIFAAAGGFDPGYALAEDFDLLLKVTRLAPVDYIDDPLLLYREHGESGTYKKIDAITQESFSILHSWRTKDPGFFRRHALRYGIFWLKFKILKMKVLIKRVRG